MKLPRFPSLSPAYSRPSRNVLTAVRLFCVLTAASLALSGCTGKLSVPGSGGGWPGAVEASGAAELSDIAELSGAARVGAEDAAARAAGRDIPGWELLYWLALSCDRLASEAREQGREPDWDAPVDDGVLSDYAKEQALSNAVLYASVEALAEEYGCTLDASDRAAMAELWERRCESHGGEAAYLNTLARFGLDRSRAETLFGVGRLYGKLCTLCREGKGLAPTATELDALARQDGAVRINRILVPAGSDRNAARNRAAVLFSKLNGAEDVPGLFADLAAGEGDAAGPRALDGSGLDAKLSEIARSLAEGQMSGIVETGEGFSILLRLPVDRNALADRWFENALQEYAGRMKTEVSDAYQALDAGEFARGLSEARARLDADASRNAAPLPERAA